MKKALHNTEALLEHLLFEADPVERPKSIADLTGPEKKDFSLDQAVDKYLIQYERESIPTSEVYESVDLARLTKFLFEQEDVSPDLNLGTDTSGPADAGLDTTGIAGDLDLSGAGAEDVAGQSTPTQAPVIQTPKINLQDFTRSVARLVNNLQSLIDLKSIVINRAEKYIRNNYDNSTAKEMIDTLERTYNLKASEQEVTSNEQPTTPQPTTAVTGPLGA
jgi:hypothetical protein